MYTFRSFDSVILEIMKGVNMILNYQILKVS